MKSRLLVITLGIWAMTACGPKNQNPLENYPDLKNAVPADKVKAPAPPAPTPDQSIFGQLITLSANNGSVMVFTEGVERSYPIETGVNLQGVKYDLVSTDLPAGAHLDPAPTPTDPDLWQLTWKPGKIPGSQNYVALSTHIAIRILDTSKNPEPEKAAEQLKAVAKTREIQLAVFANDGAPSIVMPIQGLGTQVTEGQVPNHFSVTVKDPTSAPGNPPQLTLGYDGIGMSKEIPESRGDIFVQVDPEHPEPKLQKDGSWVFYYLFDTRSQPIPDQVDKTGKPDPKADGLNVRFTLTAANARNLKASQLVQLKIKYDTKSLVPKIVASSDFNPQVIPVQALSRFDKDIVISTERGHAPVTVNAKEINAQINKISTQSSFKCQSDKTVQTCTFNIVNASCDQLNHEYEVSVKASASGAGVDRISSLTKKFRIIDTDNLCERQAQVKAKKAPQTATKSSKPKATKRVQKKSEGEPS